MDQTLQARQSGPIRTSVASRIAADKSLMIYFVLGLAVFIWASAQLHLFTFVSAFAESPSASSGIIQIQQVTTGQSYFRAITESMNFADSYGGDNGNNVGTPTSYNTGSTTYAPRSYTRSLTESFSLTESYGNARPPQSFTRALSESVGMGDGMPGSIPPARGNEGTSSTAPSTFSQGVGSRGGEDRSSRIL